ncbi:MAG: zf-TFIIB domain-containing protein [Planctomycetota bacterium]|nr:zf-TFIIB domain-containing protein [Planctomycetota bacterium]
MARFRIWPMGKCPSCGTEAGTITRFCPSCGAALAEETGAPRTAGAAQFVDGEIVFHDRKVTTGRASARKCPRCGVPMKIIAREGIEVDVCETCGGSWFDCGELNRLLQKHAKIYSYDEVREIRKVIGPPHQITERVQYVKCPVCNHLMNRTNYGKFSGVIVDRCRDHGIWLDKGEFEKISDFVAKGGLELEKIAKTEEDSQTRIRTGSSTTRVPLSDDETIWRESGPRQKSWLEAFLAEIFGFGKW